MFQLHNMKSSNKRKKRVGRGPGSGMGKTSTRGHKGSGSRSGFGGRESYEGGQERLFRKLPCRGFTRGRFKKEVFAFNLSDVEKWYDDGEVVNKETLRKKGKISKKVAFVKILSKGDCSKKVKFEADFYSKKAKEKIEKM